MITQNYRMAFKEVYTILNHVNPEDYEKIPRNIVSAIEKNMDNDYAYEMNENLDIYKQQMLPETKAILFNFYRDYWTTSEQREKIKKIQNKERSKADVKKQELYSIENIFRQQDSKKTTESAEETSMIKIDEDNFFGKMIRFFKKLFGKEK